MAIKNTRIIEISDRHATVTKAYAGASGAVTLLPAERVVNVNADAAFTLTLPPVEKCAGHFYTIEITANTNIVTIIPNPIDESAVNLVVTALAISIVTLNALNESVVLFSDGVFWWAVAIGYS